MFKNIVMQMRKGNCEKGYWWRIWMAFLPRGEGIWTSQSSKVQMPGGLAGVRYRCWSFNLTGTLPREQLQIGPLGKQLHTGTMRIETHQSQPTIVIHMVTQPVDLIAWWKTSSKQSKALPRESASRVLFSCLPYTSHPLSLCPPA